MQTIIALQNAYYIIVCVEITIIVQVINPTGKYCGQDTRSLANLMMSYMKANESSCQDYSKYLALLESPIQSWYSDADVIVTANYQRKYTRDTPQVQEKKHFYNCFQKWVANSYGEEISHQSWKDIMEEDAQYNYSNNAAQGTYDPEVDGTGSDTTALSPVPLGSTDPVQYEF